MGCDGSSDDMSEFDAANLDVAQFHAGASKGPYQMVFFCLPSGTVFSSDGVNGPAAMTAVQDFIEGGGAYGGLSAAIAIEDAGAFPWYTKELLGASSMGFAGGESGTIETVAQNAAHPVMRGIPNPWVAVDEWWLEDLPVDNKSGFHVLATLSGVPGGAVHGATPSQQPPTGGFPVVWVKPFPVASDPTGTFEGRMFYTVRGAQIARYGEPLFRQLVHQGILWAAHRM